MAVLIIQTLCQKKVGKRLHAVSWQLLFGWVLMVMIMLQTSLTQAQVGPLTPPTAIRTDSSEGYWRLKTQAATRSTRVQFYGPDHQLLYEEIIPGKWVDLNHKNQKRFDQLLTQLVTNQLVASRITTEDLPALPDESIPSSTPKPPGLATNYNPVATSYLVHAYVNQTGKLYLIVNNPERLRYKVSVIDHRKWPLYEEFTNQNRYRQRLDLSALHSTTYQVIIQIDNKPFVYQISRRPDTLVYTIESNLTESQQAVALPKSVEPKLPTATGNIDL